MLFIHDCDQTLNLVWSYIFIYNLSLIPVFLVLMQIRSSHIRTLNIFNTISANPTLSKLTILAFLSAAGVPPFAGFFSKIFIFTLICDNYILPLFTLFFILLFTSLYFYMQNIRFLNTSNAQNLGVVFEKNVRLSTAFYYSTFPITFAILFGFTLLNDVLVAFAWCFY